jgi:hypothetical protein
VEQEVTDPQQFALAYERTAKAGPARARWTMKTDWGEFKWPSAEGFPTWMRLTWRAAKPLVHAAKPVLKRATRDIDLEHLVKEGVVDLANQRSATAWKDGPTYVVADGREWIGPPGNVMSPHRVLEEWKEWFPAGDRQPLWLLGLLQGVIDVRSADPEHVRGVECRAFDVAADLSRASAATAGGLAPSCDVTRFEDLLALEITVCLDDEDRIRLVAWRPPDGKSAYSVEFYDFGAVPTIGWTRAPTLNSVSQ